MIIYIMLTDDKLCELQPKIVEFISTNLRYSDFSFKFIFNPQHIIENKLPNFEYDDIILWHPNVAGNNLDILKLYVNSVVILAKKTILIQKISKNNPVTENMAINHDFKIMYIDPSNDDITNEEWQLVIAENHYIITPNKLIELKNN